MRRPPPRRPPPPPRRRAPPPWSPRRAPRPAKPTRRRPPPRRRHGRPRRRPRRPRNRRRAPRNRRRAAPPRRPRCRAAARAGGGGAEAAAAAAAKEHPARAKGGGGGGGGNGGASHADAAADDPSAEVFAVSAGVAAVAFAVYVRTLCPSVPGGDSGELVQVALDAGVVHPPGYPTWTMLAHLRSWLPVGDLAWRPQPLVGALRRARVRLPLGRRRAVGRLRVDRRGGGRRVRLLAARVALRHAGRSVRAQQFVQRAAPPPPRPLRHSGARRPQPLAARRRRRRVGDRARPHQSAHDGLFFCAPYALWSLGRGGIHLLRPRALAALCAAGLLGLSPYLYLVSHGGANAAWGSWGYHRSLGGLWTHVTRGLPRHVPAGVDRRGDEHADVAADHRLPHLAAGRAAGGRPPSSPPSASSARSRCSGCGRSACCWCARGCCTSGSSSRSPTSPSTRPSTCRFSSASGRSPTSTSPRGSPSASAPPSRWWRRRGSAPNRPPLAPRARAHRARRRRPRLFPRADALGGERPVDQHDLRSVWARAARAAPHQGERDAAHVRRRRDQHGALRPPQLEGV